MNALHPFTESFPSYTFSFFHFFLILPPSLIHAGFVASGVLSFPGPVVQSLDLGPLFLESFFPIWDCITRSLDPQRTIILIGMFQNFLSVVFSPLPSMYSHRNLIKTFSIPHGPTLPQPSAEPPPMAVNLAWFKWSSPFNIVTDNVSNKRTKYTKDYDRIFLRPC